MVAAGHVGRKAGQGFYAYDGSSRGRHRRDRTAGPTQTAPVEIEGLDAWDRQPTEPPPSPWTFPEPSQRGPDDLVAVGGDLEPGTILSAYRQGLFPMNVNRRRLGWWSPVERAVIPLDSFRPSRSLRQSCRRYRVSVDRDFPGVIAACADPRRPHGWITPAIIDGVPAGCTTWAGRTAWRPGPTHGELAGALYGLRIGGLFAGRVDGAPPPGRLEGRARRPRRACCGLSGSDPPRRPVADARTWPRSAPSGVGPRASTCAADRSAVAQPMR